MSTNKPTSTSTKKSARRTKSKPLIERTSDGMRKEYDLSGAERGKFASRFPRDTRFVQLAPDVSEYFPDADSVNDALRAFVALSKVIKQRPARKAS